MPRFMDRTMDLPTRLEMESALAAFAERGSVRVRYGCEWQATRREGERIVLTTTDGEYACRAAVFALGVTEPWRPSIPGLENAPHYVDTHSPERYAGKRVLIVGKRNSGFEVAHGLLPWAQEITLVSPRPVETAVLAFSPLRVRYLQPYEEHARGGAGTFVIDAALERVERTDFYRVHASGTSRPGSLELEADELVLATGFRTPLRDLPELGVATVDEGRLPAQTPYWESVSAPGIYFAGNATQGSPGLRKYGATSSSSSVNGFRYNARVLARRVAERHFGIAPKRPRLPRDRVVPFLLSELARAPELWIQKGYLARVVTLDGDDARDEGVLPLEDFIDSGGPDAVAAAIELDAHATIVPVVYVRRDGRVVEHVLPPHPLYAFDSEEHRRELEAHLLTVAR